VNPGPRNILDDAQTPYDFFKLLFTEEMMEALCDFTNAYMQNNGKPHADQSMSHDPLHSSPNKLKAPPKWLTDDGKWKKLIAIYRNAVFHGACKTSSPKGLLD
jgi:hypothetical protein